MPKSEVPFVLRSRAAFIDQKVVAVEDSFHAVRALYRSTSYNTVEDVTLLRSDMGGFPYAIDPQPNAQAELVALRLHALEYGASPEAVRLLGAIKPWTKKEEAILAEKLESKKAKGGSKVAGGKGGDKAEKAAKPVGGGGKVAEEGGKKPRGNAEALAKARAARAEAGPDVRKITIIKKENPYREGSGRAASFAALKGAKTVEDYKNAGGKVKYISRWADDGLISLK